MFVQLHRTSLVILLVLALSSPTVCAGLCLSPPVERESPYHYFASFTEALIYAKSALDRVPASNGGTDPLASASDLLLGLRLAQGDFECAKHCVREYRQSTNEAIKTSAVGATVAFAMLGWLQDQYATEYRKLLDDSSTDIKIGTHLDQFAKLEATTDDVWKSLTLAATASTYAVVEENPVTHRLSGLALTVQQRDELLVKLKGAFGDRVTRGLEAGQSPLVAAAAVVYHVLAEPGRTARAE